MTDGISLQLSTAMRFFILIACTSLIFCIGFPNLTAQNQTDVRHSYPYAVVRPAQIDLGVAETGSMMRGRFYIINEGQESLLVASVRSSCGMMIPSWPSAPIAPGDSASIQVRYDSSRVGPFTRLITIHTNAWQKTLIIGVSGEVHSKSAIPVR